MKGKYLTELLCTRKAGDYIYEAGSTFNSVRKIQILFVKEDGRERSALMKYVDGNTFYAPGFWQYYETKEDAVKHAIELCEDSIHRLEYEIKNLKKL